MTTIAAALATARQHIPVAEARLLLGHLLNRSHAWLEAHRDDPLDEALAAEMSALATRRAGGEPIAYLLGRREFYGRTFRVTPDVLIPRPETELLVERACRAVTGEATILDLGTGSGCIAITLALERPQAHLVAADLSAAALAVARDNASRLGAVLDFVASDWFSALSPRCFDLIVSNPPYIAAGDVHLSQGDLRFEPAGALTDHADGLAAIRRIVAGAPAHLRPGGRLFFEHGHDQAEAVHTLLAAAGFDGIEQHRDLAGIVRVSGGAAPR